MGLKEKGESRRTTSGGEKQRPAGYLFCPWYLTSVSESYKKVCELKLELDLHEQLCEA